MDLNAANINSTTGTAAAFASRKVTAHKMLQEGSSVPVRVTRGLGGGRYEGFVAGVKVSFSSKRALKAGDTFTATVSGNGSKIILTPKTEAGAVLQNLQFQMNEVSSQQLSSLLQNAGLSPDLLSTSIFQMFTQTGLKIDAQLINRIKNIAVRFGNSQKSAAEILVMLAEKGLSADEEEIKELLLQFSGELPWMEQNEDSSDSHKNQEKLINRINAENGAWFLFPFELVQYEGGVTSGEDVKSVLGGGNIRLLFDSGKMLKLMNLDCIYNKKRYLFSLVYENGKPRNIRFNTGNDDTDINQNTDKLKKLFLAADMQGIEIKKADFCEIEGNASGSEEFYTFGGEV